jgi:hypothetical protein
MIIRAATGKKDGRDHHYGQAMIGRTRSQQEKINKRKDNRNSRKQKERNCRGYHRYKGRERKNPCEVRYRLSNQQRSCDRPSGMVRMKRMHRKRNPLGKEVLNSPRWVSRMEQVDKRCGGHLPNSGCAERKSDHHPLGKGNQRKMQRQSLGCTGTGSGLGN